MATSKHFVYQESILPVEMQALLDSEFNIVWPKDLAEHRDKVIGLVKCDKPSPITEELLAQFPSLRVIGNCGAGVDSIDLPACKRRGIKVGNTAGALDDTTADMAFTLLLASARRVVEGDRIVRDPATAKFQLNYFGTQISGTVIGIVGMGRIGLEVAKRARAFNMTVLYHNRTRRSQEIEKQVDATYTAPLPQLLSSADFVVSVLPGGESTFEMFGASEFAAMKKTAIFVNIGRGNAVDHVALTFALANGVIAAAGLDVTYPEPLPRDHPLLKLPNVTFTPHSGMYYI